MKLRLTIDDSVQLRSDEEPRKLWWDVNPTDSEVGMFLDQVWKSCLKDRDDLYAELNGSRLDDKAIVQKVARKYDTITIKQGAKVESSRKRQKTEPIAVMRRTEYRMLECSGLTEDATPEWLDAAAITLYLPYNPTAVTDYTSLAAYDFVRITYQGLEPPTYSPDTHTAFAYIRGIIEQEDIVQFRLHLLDLRSKAPGSGAFVIEQEESIGDREVNMQAIIKCVKYGVVSERWSEIDVFDLYPLPKILEDASSGGSSKSSSSSSSSSPSSSSSSLSESSLESSSEEEDSS